MNPNSKLPPALQAIELEAKKKKEQHNTIKLVIGCLMVMAGLGGLTLNNVISGIFLILAGLVAIPTILSWLERKISFSLRILKYPLIIALILCAAGFINEPVENKNNGTDVPKQPVVKEANPQSTTDSISKGQTNSKTKDDLTLSEEEQETKGRYGIVSTEMYVKKNMNDPDSYEKISADYAYHGTYFIIVLKFRGKNAFGAKVVNYIKTKTDLEGYVIKVLDE